MRRLLCASLVFFLLQAHASAERVGRCFPKMSDFEGSDLEVYNGTWDLNRRPDTGGANMHADLVVPAGRVVVDWDAVEESCSRCDGHGNLSVYFEDSGAFRLPRGVHAGVRFNAGCPTCGGASFTGRATCVHVAKDKWLAVFVTKYADCTPERKADDASNPRKNDSVGDLVSALREAEKQIELVRSALIAKLSKAEVMVPTPAPTTDNK